MRGVAVGLVAFLGVCCVIGLATSRRGERFMWLLGIAWCGAFDAVLIGAS